MLSPINAAIYSSTRMDSSPDDIAESHRLIAAHGKRIGEIPGIPTITFYVIEGDVWCVLSYTQIQWCGPQADWTPPPGFVAA